MAELQMAPVIRLAIGDDAEQIQYAPSIRDTAISFELKIPTVPDVRRRILRTLETTSWLVCEK